MNATSEVAEFILTHNYKKKKPCSILSKSNWTCYVQLLTYMTVLLKTFYIQKAVLLL